MEVVKAAALKRANHPCAASYNAESECDRKNPYSFRHDSSMRKRRYIMKSARKWVGGKYDIFDFGIFSVIEGDAMGKRSRVRALLGTVTACGKPEQIDYSPANYTLTRFHVVDPNSPLNERKVSTRPDWWL